MMKSKRVLVGLLNNNLGCVQHLSDILDSQYNCIVVNEEEVSFECCMGQHIGK